MDEDALEDALIDEFDAPSLLLHAPQQQPPLVSAQSLQYSRLTAQLSAPAAREDRATSSQHTPAPPLLSRTSAGALYPSFAALDTSSASHSATVSSAHTAAPLVAAATNAQPLYAQVFDHSPQHMEHTRAVDSTTASPSFVPLPEQLHVPPPTAPTTESQRLPATSTHPPPAHTEEQQPAMEPSPVRAPVPSVLSQRDLDAKQRDLEREVAGYEQQLDYLALALAGNTPHQVAERARRERERHVREQQRVLATEERVLHQLERLHEREQRRAKVRAHVTQARTSSRSPSPEARLRSESAASASAPEDTGA